MTSAVSACPLLKFPPSVLESLKKELAAFIESTSTSGKLRVEAQEALSYMTTWFDKYYVENEHGQFFTLNGIVSSREAGKLDTPKLVCDFEMVWLVSCCGCDDIVNTAHAEIARCGSTIHRKTGNCVHVLCGSTRHWYFSAEAKRTKGRGCQAALDFV